MAWGTTDRGGAGGYGADPSVGDTFTPTEGNIIIVVTADWTDDVNGVTGWSITFAQQGTTINQGGNYIKVWAGIVGASPGSAQAALDTAATATNYEAAVVEISGADVSATVTDIFNNQAAISESVYNGGTANPIGTGFASAFASSTNATLTVCFSTGTGQTFTTQSGFTSIAQQSGTQAAIDIHLKTTEEANPTYSPVSSFQTDGAIAFEMQEATASGGGTSNLTLLGVG